MLEHSCRIIFLENPSTFTQRTRQVEFSNRGVGSFCLPPSVVNTSFGLLKSHRRIPTAIPYTHMKCRIAKWDLVWVSDDAEICELNAVVRQCTTVSLKYINNVVTSAMVSSHEERATSTWVHVRLFIFYVGQTCKYPVAKSSCFGTISGSSYATLKTVPPQLYWICNWCWANPFEELIVVFLTCITCSLLAVAVSWEQTWYSYLIHLAGPVGFDPSMTNFCTSRFIYIYILY